MNKFNMDNTDGFNSNEISKMNSLYFSLVSELNPNSESYRDECDYIAEQILRKFNAA